MILKTNKVKKAIVFAGDQFTWGQGLHYYTNLSTIKIPEYWKFDRSILTHAHIKFIEKYRFARLVADHFDTIEYVREPNYASNDLIIDWFTSCFENDTSTSLEGFNTPKLHYDEVGIVFFQMTRLERNAIIIEGVKDTIENFAQSKREILDIYLDKNELSFTDWYDQVMLEGAVRVKSFLQNCETYGIKVILSTWNIENFQFINNDSYLQSKLLPIKYKDQTYYSFTELAGDTRYGVPPNSELVLSNDDDNFVEGPRDIHLSRLGHKVVADSIINYIEQNNLYAFEK